MTEALAILRISKIPEWDMLQSVPYHCIFSESKQCYSPIFFYCRAIRHSRMRVRKKNLDDEFTVVGFCLSPIRRQDEDWALSPEARSKEVPGTVMSLKVTVLLITPTIIICIFLTSDNSYSIRASRQTRQSFIYYLRLSVKNKKCRDDQCHKISDALGSLFLQSSFSYAI